MLTDNNELLVLWYAFPGFVILRNTVLLSNSSINSLSSYLYISEHNNSTEK